MSYRRALCNDYSHSPGGSATAARSQVQAVTGRGTEKKTQHWCGGPTAGTRGMERTELKSWRTHVTYSFVRIITEISRAINNSLSFRRLPSILCICVYVSLCIHAYSLLSLSLYINYTNVNSELSIIDFSEFL